MSQKNEMKGSRLYELFELIPKKELKELKKFVDSPFFNQRKHVSDLLDYLIWVKYKRGKSLDRQLAFAHLFPDLPFDDHKLRLSMSLLLKVMEKYLVWQQLNKEETEVKIKLAKAYRELNLSRHFSSTLAEVEKIQKTQGIRHADYYQYRYEWYLEQYLFNSEQNRMEDLQLAQVHENLDIAYITSKLRQSCFSISHQNIYNKEYSFGMLSAILTYIEEQSYLDIPAISVYFYCYRALQAPEHYEYFIAFKKQIFKYQNLFPKEEIRDLFLLATNYCIRLMNQGVKRFAQEGLSIYKEGLKNEILLLNGVLSRYTYRNIVAKAIVSKDFDWAENFILQYKDRLESKYQDNAFSFNLAWLEYERKNYDQALILINQSSFDDLLINLSMKTIAMKIYYELQAFDLLYSHLEAMQKFIRRKEIIAYHKKNYLNTIHFVKKLLDLPISNRAIRQRLRQEILGIDAIAEKTWILRQLE